MVDLVLAGMMLALAGLGMVLVSTFAEGRRTESGVKGGGVVMVGPIPIIFGSDARWATVAIVLAIVLLLLTVALNLV
jgi:uncharacterized protein (TIGR00304 family)